MRMRKSMRKSMRKDEKEDEEEEIESTRSEHLSWRSNPFL